LTQVDADALLNGAFINIYFSSSFSLFFAVFLDGDIQWRMVGQNIG
jgi:hypothetical protein